MAELATVARPYAEAAFRLGVEGRNLAQWSEMLALVDAVVTDEQFAKYIGDPNTHEGALEALILGALGERLDGKGRNLVQVLVQNRRLELVPHIRTLFEDLKREQEGTVEARIISALPIADDKSVAISKVATAHARKPISLMGVYTGGSSHSGARVRATWAAKAAKRPMQASSSRLTSGGVP